MKDSGLTLTRFWVANDLEIVSSSVFLSFGLALGDGVALDEVVETKFREGPNIDFRAWSKENTRVLPHSRSHWL